MKKIIFLFIFIISISNLAAKTERIKVAVSIYPVGDIVKQIAGNKAEVMVIVKPGESPHTFSPRPSDMKYLAKADILFKVGLGLEFWADKLERGAHNKKLKSVELSKNIKELIRDEENIGEYNPHIWFSPLNAILMSETVKNELSSLDSKNSNYYEKNYLEFIKKLKLLDSEFKSKISKFRKKEFVCFHPAYVYFERDYGIKHILSIEEFPGKEPTSKYLKTIIERIKKDKIEVIFAEPQFSMKSVNLISKETGVKIGILDPIGGVKGRESYIELMKYNFEQIERVLK